MAKYRVVNSSSMPIAIPWNKTMLTSEELERYEDFKQSDEYSGITPEERQNKRQLGEAVNVKEFFDREARGIAIKGYRKSREGVREAYREFCWVIGCDYSKLMKRNAETIKFICDKFDIPNNPAKETKKQVVDKIQAKLGSNEAEVSQGIYDNLKPFINKPITQRLKLGQQVPDVINSGVLEVNAVDGFDDYAEDGFAPEPQDRLEKLFREDLEDEDYGILQKMAKEREVNAAGTKAQIIEKLLESNGKTR